MKQRIERASEPLYKEMYEQLNGWYEHLSARAEYLEAELERAQAEVALMRKLLDMKIAVEDFRDR